MRYSASALPIEDPSMLTGEYRTLASADESGRRTPNTMIQGKAPDSGYYKRESSAAG